jgi:carbon dioxide concentrating mechanism protein CcmO
MTDAPYSLVLIEVSNLVPALVLVDQCTKRAGVRVVGIENTMGTEQCIKLAGATADVLEAAQAGLEAARRMGARAEMAVLPGPLPQTRELAAWGPEYMAMLEIHDALVKREQAMNNSQALGLLETQGLVAALHATDEMLKASAVELVGKEKIGAAYVTIIVRGDVAAVQAAVAAGRQTVERLGGKLIMADVITRPHPELVALLPK